MPSITPELHVPPESLTGAIREIQRTAVASAEPTIVMAKIVGLDPDECADLAEAPVAFVPAGDGKVEARSLVPFVREALAVAREERLRTATGPDRREGTAVHQSLDSFIAHLERFKADHSAVWADEVKLQLISVLDYHPAGAASAPRWGKHRGVYACPLSGAWEAWGAGELLTMDQDAFAAFLDAHDREIVVGDLPNGVKAPDPAQLLTMAGNLEAYSNQKATRKRGENQRLTIAFSTDTGFSGEVQPPPSFLIRIPVFSDADPRDLEVRLRAEVTKDKDARVLFTVRIHAAEEVLRKAFESICDRVEADAGVPLFMGTPE